MNEEFIYYLTLLQKEIKRLQNITNDLSYQLIMNGQTPQIKESERVPIDLSINPLRRREHKNKIGDVVIVKIGPLIYQRLNQINMKHPLKKVQAK